MNSRRGSGQGRPPGDSRSEPLPVIAPPVSRSTWAGNIGHVDMPQSQNLNMVAGGPSTVVNIGIRQGESPQTTNSQRGDPIYHLPGPSFSFSEAGSEELHDSTSRADHEIYSNQLLSKKRGYPLWVPGPGMQHPVEYRRQGTSIGDVGIITSSGEFDFLFNIFLPADHPINGGMVPTGFQPLARRELERDIQRTAVYGPNTHLASASVRKITSAPLTSESSIHHSFESTAKEAAILVMPHGATTQNLLNTWGVRTTISEKAKDWYTYVRFTRGRDVKNGDIRVVVGIDKVPAWGIAISSCNHGQTASFMFKHDETHAYKYKWDCTGASGRVGPLPVETDDLVGDIDVLHNQCIFVRTINFTLSGKVWNDLPSTALQSVPGLGKLGRRDSASGDRRTPRGRHSSSGSGDSPFLSKQESSHSNQVNFDAMEPGANHPSAGLHNSLHEKFPRADLVITDDMAVLSDDDMGFPEPEEHIKETHEPQNDWDVIHLFRKGDTKLRGSSSMKLGKVRRMSTLDGAVSPVIESDNKTVNSPREGENQDKVPANPSVSHEPELHSDPLQESILDVHNGDLIGCGIDPPRGSQPSSEGSATDVSSNESESSDDGGNGADPSSTVAPSPDTISVDTINEENSLNDPPDPSPMLTSQEESDVVESSLNHDPSVVTDTTDNSQITSESEDAKSREVPTTLPELPTIENFDLRLEVFTHKDLRHTPTGELSEWDNERLAALGASLLNKIVTLHLFSKHAACAEEQQTLRMQYTSPNVLNSWLDVYQLKKKFQVPPKQSDAIYNDLNQMATYFHSYIGAVFITRGLPAVQTWITGLIEGDANIGPQAERNTDPSGHASTSNDANIGPQEAEWNNNPPGHASTSNSGPPSSGPSNLSMISLALVNEMASQRGVSISYVPSQEGPDHQPTWTTRCYIDSVEKGVGVGKTRKIAKEEAGRQACFAMGWVI